MVDSKKINADNAAKRSAALDKHITKTIQRATGPSMVPDSLVKKAEHESAPLAEMQEVITDAAVRLHLVRLIAADTAWAVQEKEAKGKRGPIKKAIKALLKGGEKRFMCDGNRVVYYNAPRTTIIKDLLLMAGILPSVIASCTVTKDAWTLKVTPPGAVVEEDEEE